MVFTWNGTTSGVRVPNGDWIAGRPRGADDLRRHLGGLRHGRSPWDKLDVVTWSWQKVLGGEAAHGMLALSPRAVERLESYTPAWPLPKIFRLTKGGKLIEGIFEARRSTRRRCCASRTISTRLTWAAGLGGLPALQQRADANFAVIDRFVRENSWLDFLAEDAATRSNTSVCLNITDPEIVRLAENGQAAFAKALVSDLAAEGVAVDIGAYRDAPPGLRIWTGSTIETSDVEALMPWLSWAFSRQKAALATAP